MPRRLANLFLLVAVLVLVATGFLPWLFSDMDATPLYDLHRLAGIALVLSLVWKYAIARGSAVRRIPRREGSLAISAFASGALLFVVASGIAWTAGAVSFDRPLTYSVLNLHVFAGVALVIATLTHAAWRWERRPPIARLAGRRAALRFIALGAVATLFATTLDRAGSARRITGSRHAGSFTANSFPLTIWNFDSVPAVDPATWRLGVTGAVSSPLELPYAALSAFGSREIDAVIDCTSGWWSEQRWRGIALGEIIAASAPQTSASRVRVMSVTGHAWTFGLAEIGDALLATHVGGEVLAPGHGYPLRLVVPGRRGFQWIKWVDRIELA